MLILRSDFSPYSLLARHAAAWIRQDLNLGLLDTKPLLYHLCYLARFSVGFMVLLHFQRKGNVYTVNLTFSSPCLLVFITLSCFFLSTNVPGTSQHYTPPTNTPTPRTQDYQQSLTPFNALQLCSFPWCTAALQVKFQCYFYKQIWNSTFGAQT